ncbi:MAG: WbqC family protein [Bacteroidota bacterium]
MGLFHKIALADEFVFFDQVQYVPKDYINRNEIKTNTGSTLLTVPVFTKGYLNKTIAQIEIDNSTRWSEKHWRSIYLNYKKTPYFSKYADFMEDIYKKQWMYLADLNFSILLGLLDILEIKVKIHKAGDYQFNGTKSNLVLDMCLQLKATKYIFGLQGKNYAETQEFIHNGIIPYFQEYKHPTYSQLHGDFKPNMSVIDLLFNEGPRSMEIIHSNNIVSL